MTSQKIIKPLGNLNHWEPLHTVYINIFGGSNGSKKIAVVYSVSKSTYVFYSFLNIFDAHMKHKWLMISSKQESTLNLQ